MANPTYSRDDDILAPPGLDEIEQCAVMAKAAQQYSGFEELTAIPADMHPLGFGWIPARTIEAEVSHRVYKVYLRMPAHSGPAPLGTPTNSPPVDHGTKAVTKHKPPKVAGLSPSKVQDTADRGINPKSKTVKPKQGLESEGLESGILIRVITDLQKVVSDPSATEEQIVEKVKAGLVAQTGARDGDPLARTLSKQIANGLQRAQDLRNTAFESELVREERSPGSVSEETLKGHVQNVLSGERQLQLMGIANDDNSKAMELTVRALKTVVDRRIKVVTDLLDQEKRSPGSVSDQRLKTALQGFIEVDRQCQLLGICVPGETEVMSEALRISEQRKAKRGGS